MRSRTVMTPLLALGLVFAGCGDDEDITTSATDVSAETCATRSIDEVERDPSTGLPLVRATDDELAAAVASTFCAEYRLTGTSTSFSFPPVPPVLPEADAVCIASRLVEALGPDRVRELRLDLGPWSVLGFGLANNDPLHGNPPVDEAEAERIVETVQSCSQDWELLFIRSATEGTDNISDASARCTAERLDDAQSHTIMVNELDRTYDDPAVPDAQPFHVVVQPLIDALDQCLMQADSMNSTGTDRRRKLTPIVHGS